MPPISPPSDKFGRAARRVTPSVCYAAIYLLAIAFIVFNFATLESPRSGFAWLPQFGTKNETRWTEELKHATREATSEYGYDGQFYAQLALDPLLQDPATVAALDNASFRARRPLLPVLAHLIGLGEPNRVLQVYSVLNLVFWLLFAALAWRWFPPANAQNLFRYLAVIFASGLMASLTQALLDGPAMTLLLLGMYWVERGRPILGAGAMGLAGLTKETSILAATGLPLPDQPRARAAIRWIGACFLVVAPVLLWTVYLHATISRGNALGSPQNFAWPLAGWWQAATIWLGNVDSLTINRYGWITAAFLLSLPLQFGFLLARWRPRDPWWRIGATFSLFGLVLGLATWEGLVGSAARIVLPATFAFNLLVPRGGRWIPLLLVGNSLSFVGLFQIATTQAPNTEPFHEYAPAEGFARGPDRLLYRFDDGWYEKERKWRQHRRWASGSAAIALCNKLSQPAFAELEGSLISIRDRAVSLQVNGETIATYHLASGEAQPLKIAFPLVEGDNEILFSTAEPAEMAAGDSRGLSFSLRDYHLSVHRACAP